MRLLFFRRRDADPSIASIPFEAELYAVAPERFGGWHASDGPPAAASGALTEEQMRGELALLVLRWLCLACLGSSTLGVLVVLWRVAIR